MGERTDRITSALRRAAVLSLVERPAPTRADRARGAALDFLRRRREELARDLQRPTR